ncbi:MAG: AMP-binding protein [Bdellovibrio sp.]|nr:AMP-binding protein [Bdellovibrio sp.]
MTSPFNFSENAPNQLLVNPKATKQEKNDLIYLQFEFEKNHGTKGYFLVPSSGSSKSENETVKLIALTQDAVITSAKRINEYFNFTADLNWGLVLPYFHVAGLGVYARAHFANSAVFFSDWEPGNLLNWINEKKIHLMSLVPTQIFDIVQRQIICPETVRIVFVGAASLSPELKEKALQLKWPIVEAYGMTETASMIAVKLEDQLEVMTGVSVAQTNDKLKIKCESLMTCAIQKVNNQVIFKTLENGWLQTEDRVEIKSKDGIKFLTLLGRDSDFIKINGEGVSLSQLRQALGAHPEMTLLALPNQRTGHEIVLAHETSVSRDTLKLIINEYHNKVRPFEFIKKIFAVEQIPKADLGKIKFKNLEEMIKGNPYEKL